MKKKYLFVGHRFGKVGRSGYYQTRRLAETFPNYSDYLIENNVKNWKEFLKLSRNYDRVIFVTQNLINYRLGLDFMKLMNLDHLLFIREEHNLSRYNSCTNGFHYYRNHDSIKFFFPRILDFNLKFVNLDRNEYPTIGFYYRPGTTPDSNLFVLDLIKSIGERVNVVALGYKNNLISKISNVVTYKNTTDNHYFFNAIDYFIYPMSVTFDDPFPHTLLEAVQCNKQIIIPELPGRNHKDGIDDVMDCINFKRTLDFSSDIDNSNTILRLSNFKRFYSHLFENNCEYKFDRNRFDNFYTWIEKEVLT